ncbi:MAG: 2-isopropylmalate synthase [Oscillospiraceae bacterium]|jgi:2-isopropylmalate synthase|nr:2-isopropylmalate synthase [Oscillospiraceae bacterium]
MKNIRIFDTTLRDGEQSPGCSMNLQEKLEIAARLEALKVDVIEAGFAVSSPDDFEAVRAVAGSVRRCGVASLARATEKDIDAAWEALKGAAKPCIHVFLATSGIHMEYKLKMTPEEVLAKTSAMVRYAKGLCPTVEFSAEDATRSDPAFLARVFSAAVAAGADVINVPDTVGYAAPQEIYELVSYLRANVAGIGKAVLSIHCHNDLGMAVANSLSAVKAGADQVECTLNGIGERAGNAALEEIALSLATKRAFYGAETGIDTKQIYRASRTLSGIIGVTPTPNKPIVGANAFAHEAGIHQHGVLANPLTYEIMNPADVGIPSSKMVLGKHSGRHAFEDRLKDLGFDLSGEALTAAFGQFKKLADRKKAVSDEDIAALAGEQTLEIADGYHIERFVVNSGSTISAMATVKLSRGDEVQEEASTGDGPINAAFNAISRIVGGGHELEDFSIRSVTEGGDALGEAVVKLKRGNEIITGRGLSTDILEASIKAYVNGINKMAVRR